MHASFSTAAGKARGFRFHREYALLAVVVLIFLGLSLSVPYFATAQNLLVLLRKQAPLAILAVGMTLVILTGGIDLSVGSIAAVAAVSMGRAWELTGSAPIALAAALGVGALCGAANGLLVSAGRVPPLIVTLATLSVFRGLAFALWSSTAAWRFPPSILAWSSAGVGGLAAPFWIALALLAASGLYLARTAGGRAVYAIGANARAAELSGVPVDRIRFRLYTLSGLLAGLVAILFVAHDNSAKPDLASGLELGVITVVVLGGTSVAGGEGSMAGTALAFLALVFIQNGLYHGRTVFGLPGELEGIAVAALLVGALLLDAAARRRRGGS